MNQASNKKLYVGSLPFSTTEEELHELFSAYGSIASVRIVTDKFTGMSKGFGFVEMENAGDAGKAVEGLNGKAFNGRTLIVNEARPEQPRAPRTGGGGGREDRGGGFRGGDRPFRSRREH
jgi:cold-inducible RNA-binding protein